MDELKNIKDLSKLEVIKNINTGELFNFEGI